MLLKSLAPDQIQRTNKFESKNPHPILHALFINAPSKIYKNMPWIQLEQIVSSVRAEVVSLSSLLSGMCVFLQPKTDWHKPDAQ